MFRQVIFWSAILLALTTTHSKQMQNIDAITQAYLTAEKYLWQLIYSTDRYNRPETFAYIYDTHEEHLGKNFGESGRFERLARLYPSEHSDYRDSRTSTWRVIDAIAEINATALNTYRILSHRTYENLPHLVNDTGENVPREIASICKHIDAEFWIAAKKVSPNFNSTWKWENSANSILELSRVRPQHCHHVFGKSTFDGFLSRNCGGAAQRLYAASNELHDLDDERNGKLSGDC